MAREPRGDVQAANIWQNMKVQCPICNNSFKSWYCPNCGLPKNNSAYANYEGIIYYCGPNHFRCELGTVSEYQLCSKCYIPNPFHAKYCRNCGENISSHARDIDGHGWVDLGLSVLWSSETMYGFYMWMDTNACYNETDCLDISSKYRENQRRGIRKDVASYKWGGKWRIPTKEEFEELVEKCKWEKIFISKSSVCALKVIGPNGNYMILSVTGSPSTNYWKNNYVQIIGNIWSFWTSTEDKEKEGCAYNFVHGLGHGSNMKYEEWEKLKEEEKKSLWLSTSFDKKMVFKRSSPKWVARAIRPVADIKWKGCL